jgi:AraC family transcriptional regulator of adaptative response/methylated-DNA-[protein]-cysteine methyltransferase
MPHADISRLLQQQEPGEIPAGLTVAAQRGDQDSSPVSISWGIAPGWFGDCLIAVTSVGICWLDLAPSGATLAQIEQAWMPVDLYRDDELATQHAALVFAGEHQKIGLHLIGTEFQLKVWQALLGIAPGNYMTYGQIAHQLGVPSGARAVGGAVGANNVGLLVPCHRVLPESGGPGAYRWGADLKVALLQRELASIAA